MEKALDAQKTMYEVKLYEEREKFRKKDAMLTNIREKKE